MHIFFIWIIYISDSDMKSRMESRKLQMTGGSSYIVTLPKEWIESCNLKKNDTVYLENGTDGSLIINSRGDSGPRAKDRRRIEITDDMDTDLAYRLLVGSYMAGYDTIELTSKTDMDPSISNAAEDFTQTSIGFEILEEDGRNIVIKDLMDPAEMRPRKSLDRMRILVRNMIAETLAALKEGRSAPDLDKRDRDIDRLDWLIARQNHIFQSRPALYRKIGISPEEMTDFYIVSRIIERIGDHVVSMNGYLANVDDPKALSDIAGIVEGMGLASLFLESMDTLMGKDAVAANDCIGRCRTALEGIVKLHSVGTGLAADSAVAVSMLSSNVKRIIEYSIDIAEIAINSAMD